MIDREGEESLGIFKWMKIFVKGLTAGWALRPVTETEKVSSTVTEKTKSLNCQRG
jgi:hypothetical protein